MNKKTFVASIAIVAILVVAIVVATLHFYRIRNNEDHQSSDITTLADSPAITNVDYTVDIYLRATAAHQPETIVPDISKIALYEHMTEEFEYPLKSKYDSRIELLQEQLDLRFCYDVYLADRRDDIDRTQNAKVKYERYMIEIETMLLKFPPNEDEELQSKLDRLNNSLFGEPAIYQQHKKAYEANPNDPELEKIYKNLTERIAKENSVIKDYNEGKITIDQALAELGIIPASVAAESNGIYITTTQ